MCKPETVSFYFENLETTAYEALSCLKDDSDDYFLKLLSIISVTLSKVCYFISLKKSLIWFLHAKMKFYNWFLNH